jgi:hypothetical protein
MRRQIKSHQLDLEEKREQERGKITSLFCAAALYEKE